MIYGTFGKYLSDQAHAFFEVDIFAIGDDDTCGFLPAVLQGEETEVCGDGGPWNIVDSKDAAMMTNAIVQRALPKKCEARVKFCLRAFCTKSYGIQGGSF